MRRRRDEKGHELGELVGRAMLVDARIQEERLRRIIRLRSRHPILVGVTGDQLVGDVGEVHAGHLRLRPDVQERIARPQDKRGLPTRRDGTQRVPGVAGDQAHFSRLGLQCPRHGRVDLRRGLMAADVIDAEPPFEEIQQAGLLELSP
jgi:hypothetical protein